MIIKECKKATDADKEDIDSSGLHLDKQAARATDHSLLEIVICKQASALLLLLLVCVVQQTYANFILCPK